MAKEYRPYGLEQAYLLPQAPREWLPEGHLALFLEDAVSLLDIEEIAVRFKRGRGPRAYHPRMLLSLLLYGYCTGVYSSRKIAAACETDVAFRALCGGQFPDFRTVSDFRKNHLEVFAGLFTQVLGMCREAGLVKMGHLSLDGSKYQANASKHKAMSYQRIQETEPWLEGEIAELLRRAAEIDEAEDAEYGDDARGDELPEELRRREVRLAKMREAKLRLEERAKRRARARAEGGGSGPEEAEAAAAKAVPRPKEQSNFTDPDSRIMKSSHGWIQGYNAQVLVEAGSGVIVAQEVTPQSADSPRLGPMLELLDQNLAGIGVPATERCPLLFTADAGYCSERNLGMLAERQFDAYVATGRERHHQAGIGQQVKVRTPLRSAMRSKLQTPEGREVYARRKVITEPVHGLIKHVRGFRQFLLRGIHKVAGEFTLVSLTHNLLKLWRASPVAAGSSNPA